MYDLCFFLFCLYQLQRDASENHRHPQKVDGFDRFTQHKRYEKQIDEGRNKRQAGHQAHRRELEAKRI